MKLKDYIYEQLLATESIENKPSLIELTVKLDEAGNVSEIGQQTIKIVLKAI